MRKWLPLTAICLGALMLLVDVTIVNVALPSMAGHLHSSFSSLQWVLDGYALALAATLLTAGTAADRWGRRRLYLVGLAVFTAASLACGLAPNAELLIAARIVQGVGGAAMFATTTALLSITYRGADRGVAFGVWGAVAGASAAAGPLLGGLLTEQLGWRAVFLVNLPVAALTAVLARRSLGESKAPTGHGIDYAGAATFTVAVAAVVFGLTRAGQHGWTDPVTVAAAGLAVLTLVAFVLVERAHPAPMLDLWLFTRPAFGGLMAGALLLQGAAFAALTLTSLWLQSVHGLGPMLAGATGSAPQSVMALLVAALGGRWLHHRAPHRTIGFGLLLVGAGVLLQLLVSTGSSWPALLPGLLVSGIGVGMAVPTSAATVLAAVPHERAGMAGGALNTFRQLGFAVGIAVLGTAFSGRVSSYLAGTSALGQPPAAAAALAGGRAPALIERVPVGRRAAADHLVHAAFAAGLDRVYLIAGLAGLLGGVLVLLLVRPSRPTAGTERSASADRSLASAR